MRIKYDELENTIEINDDLKNNYFLLKLLMVLNLANALIRLVKRKITEYGIEEYFWIAIGISSLIILYYFLFKKSTAEKIKVEEIKRLNEKSVFGTKRFSLDLKNGKNRILGNFKDEFELAEMRKLFHNLGIKTD